MRASSAVNCQLTFAFLLFLNSCHARTSFRTTSMSSILLFKHCPVSTFNSISAIFSQLPCFGVYANSNNNIGIYLHGSSNDNHIYNNYFGNTNNAWDNGTNVWNITIKQTGTNIIGGSYLGGNYWGDYEGEDLNDDGLGDTSLPYNSSGNIHNGGDWLPLTEVDIIAPPTITSFSLPSTVSDTEGATRTFNVTIDQTVNVSWLINGTEVHNNMDVTSASYTNTSAALGVWNVSAVVEGANGTVVQTWTWNVAPRVPGDVDDNGEVNIDDATLLFTWVSFPDGRGTTYVLH